METRIIKKGIEHQNIGGKEFIIDEKVSLTLDPDEVIYQALTGNYACKNFIDRRKDFKKNFKHKLYYGKVNGLGYIMADDEFEEEDDK